MTFCLESTIIKPTNLKEIRHAVILLHGYGGDGKDISTLSLNWKRHMPNTIFICPNGHERCSINPTGYQWFDLTKEDPNYILEQSIIAENKLNKFLDEIKNEYQLENKNICLSGFSQGCMMSINLGLTSNEKFKSVIGFSGKIINKIDLQERMNSKTDVLLFHGDADEVVPPSSLLEAKDFLERNKIKVEVNMIKNCSHHIPIEALSLALKYIKKII